MTPEQVVRARQNPQQWGTLERYFGLGLISSADCHQELVDAGMDPHLVERLRIFEGQQGPFAVSACSQIDQKLESDATIYVIHNHWPPRNGESDRYVHYGAESKRLTNFILDQKSSKRQDSLVVDLGGASGGLAFSLAQNSPRVVYSIDRCERAVYWGKLCYEAQKHLFLCGPEYRFIEQTIGQVGIDPLQSILSQTDLVVFNPPMMIAQSGNDYSYRAGGPTGIELPLLFIDYACRLLRPKGEIMCLATNPVLKGGRGLLFDQLAKKNRLQIGEAKCLNEHFNQSALQKDQKSQATTGKTAVKKEKTDPCLGANVTRNITRVELWALRMQKTK
jgi:tRNA1(Val) A37 N6-methylase TrmN6